MRHDAHTSGPLHHRELYTPGCTGIDILHIPLTVSVFECTYILPHLTFRRSEICLGALCNSVPGVPTIARPR